MRIHNATVDKALLQCDVEGAFPKPIVKWKDGAGKLLPAENLTERVQKGRHYVTTFIFINVTDHVHCVVTQEEIHHNTSAETYVFVSGETSSFLCDQSFVNDLLHLERCLFCVVFQAKPVSVTHPRQFRFFQLAL